MLRSMTVVSVLLVAAAGLIVGVTANWTIAFGIFWFGASCVLVLAVAQAFRKDMTSRFPGE